MTEQADLAFESNCVDGAETLYRITFRTRRNDRDFRRSNWFGDRATAEAEWQRLAQNDDYEMISFCAYELAMEQSQ